MTSQPSPAAPETRPDYPPADRLDLVEELHGHRVADPYRWLEDPDDPRTAAWSAAQDALCAARLEALPGREHLRGRLRALLGAGVESPPVWRGERRFLVRRTAGQEHGVLLTVDPDGTERVLVDPVALDPSGLTTLDAWQPSKEGGLLAYQVSEGGTEESVLRVLDVATGEVVDGPVDRARYSPVAWLPGGRAYYYVRRLAPEQVPAGEEQYHRRVWLHRLGTDPAEDVEVLGAGLERTNYYGVSVSLDGRWLAVSASAGTAPRNDLWLADLSASSPGAPDLRPVQQGVDAQTSLHVGRDGRAYVLTDRDAPRGRLAVADPADPAHGGWRDLVPEDPEAVLESYAVLDGEALAEPLLLVSWTRHAVGEVSVHDLATGARRGSLDLPGLGSVGGLRERPEGGHEAWFSYTDHVTPPTVHRYDATTGEVSVWARPPGSVQVPPVRTRQVVYRSADGTRVRMFVVSPAADGDGPDRPRPTVLYGYGGFGVPLAPGYSASTLAWVEAGGVYVVANLRGGSEEGEAWHRAGMREHKQAVFDDFHAAAEHLLAEGWTTREQLSVSGGSNGGLLVGAALTQRPDLFAAVVCSAPLLDMVRYERFGLGATWNDEYGTAEDPEELGWLLSYSPYHRVREGVDYPAVLFTVFDGDTRVDPLHARKLCAALQHATSGPRPVLLRREGDVGHGARSVTRTVALSADSLAFAAARTGLPLGAAG
ncbi:prolyl oligopeptidase family serine peptidase [Vallicoccus soli]|uniref:prolyl oligopeptidase n=1 Tax=Vallicoccus soli TaxID=2339232 RepID=A0A3A3Z1J7_9ACTN|nr:prolyl oligopeptidase family serine peptidase [Vallicoccus soli]RJK97125.1 S9 family peptidase [Vallicoccus soli]